MTTVDQAVPADPTTPFRRYLVLLAALGVAGTAIELAMLRHWHTGVQLVPWYALGALTIAIVALVVRPTRATVTVVRVLALVVALSALYGVWEHVHGNYDAGYLDRTYGAKWETMAATTKWWKAFTKTVGPSPALAPAVLAQAALCLLFATRRHPAMARRELVAAAAPASGDAA